MILPKNSCNGNKVLTLNNAIVGYVLLIIFAFAQIHFRRSLCFFPMIYFYHIGANENNSISTVCTSNYIGDATCDMVDEKDLEVKNNLVHRSTMRERGIAITVRLTRSSLGQIQIRVKVQTFSHTVIACAIVIVGGIIC